MAYKAENQSVKLMLDIDITKPFILSKIMSDRLRFKQFLMTFIAFLIKITPEQGKVVIILNVLEEVLNLHPQR